MSEPNPYRDESDAPPENAEPTRPVEAGRVEDFDGGDTRQQDDGSSDSGANNPKSGASEGGGSDSAAGSMSQPAGGDAPFAQSGGSPRGTHPQGGNQRPDRQEGRNGRRHRRGRGRGPRRDQAQSPGVGQGSNQGQQQPQPQGPVVVVATSETRGWFDPARDGGYIRRPGTSYLAEAGDAWVPPHLVRQYGLRRADLIVAGVGIDPRGRLVVAEVRTINDVPAADVGIRPEFNSLTASYPERKLFLETGRSAKGGHELTRRAIDLIAPIGYGQRALIVAPARAGKTTLLHAITEGVAINHPKAQLLILLVDERPEEVSEAISWGVGEVVSSSFDQPAQRHVEVTEMVLARAHRLVEQGRDVVIVLDSLTRMARAHNTAERGSGRTLSGGLDATSMAKPKAFFGSARNIPDSSGGGSLTIISTALVETGSRMDDVIFEEFKGTGNCEIKLDRSLAEKRIYPAIDIGTSGTRREEKLFRADQLDAVFTLRRGLSQMPSQSAMEWLIKRIAATPSNDQLLAGL